MPRPKNILISPKLYLEVVRAHIKILNGTSFSKISFDHIPIDQVPLFTNFLYEMVRWHYRTSWQLIQVSKSDPNKWNPIVRSIVGLGFCLLQQSTKPDYAVVNNCVEAAKLGSKAHVAGLVNACLRRFISIKTELTEKSYLPDEAFYSHPRWLMEVLKLEFPECWPTICEANNSRPPMFLRVNRSITSISNYINLLSQSSIDHEINSDQNQSIRLDLPISVKELPGYADGLVSVQDLSSQIIGSKLDLKSGDRVLDMCASPGGKTSHLLEKEKIDLLAIEIDKKRRGTLDSNLERLHLKCKTLQIDVRQVSIWWDSKYFDHVLLDAPCSSLGVIRKYPDIKLHRKKEDILQYSKIQMELLLSGWKVLNKGGTLIYSVCTILGAETKSLINKFRELHSDAYLIESQLIMPGENGMNGFYYAKLNKR